MTILDIVVCGLIAAWLMTCFNFCKTFYKCFLKKGEYDD